MGVALATAIPVFGTKAIALGDIADILADGVGGQLESTLMVIGLGAMIGRVMGDAGAAQRIALKMVDRLGIKWVQLAMVVTAMLVGVTMFYEVAFVIIVPIAFTLARATKTNLLWVGLPMSIALSTMHSFLPPHPGPTAVAGTYQASVGLTLAYGLLIAIPIAAAIALVWPRLPFVKAMNPEIPAGLVSDKLFKDEELPSLAVSLSMALLPVVLIAGAAIFELAAPDSPANGFVQFIGAAPIALLITLLLAIWVFGPRMGRSLDEVGASALASAKPMAIILMVIGAGGAFKQVLTKAGIADYIAHAASGWNVSPIILAWAIAVILRIALGSATVGRGYRRRRRRPAGRGQRCVARTDGARHGLRIDRLLARQRSRLLVVQGVLRAVGHRGAQDPHHLHHGARHSRPRRRAAAEHLHSLTPTHQGEPS